LQPTKRVHADKEIFKTETYARHEFCTQLIPSACPKGGEAMPLADPFSQSDAFGREAPG